MEMRVQCGWWAGCEMNQEQPLEALHDDEGECNRKALRLAAVECLGTGTMDVVCRDNLGQ